MKKIISIIVLIFISSTALAVYPSKSPFYNTGDFVEGEIKITDKYIYPLPPGKWKVIAYWQEVLEYPYLNSKEYLLAKIEGKNKIKEAIVIGKIHTGVMYTNRVDWYVVQEIVFDDEDEGGCYERPEYNHLFLYRKGFGHNCLRISARDIARKSIHDDPEDVRFMAEMRKKYIFPKLMLESFHSFYSRSIKPEMFYIFYYMNSEFLGAPALNGSIQTSEFHPFNINNYPKHKKALSEFTKLAKKRHLKHERFSKAPSRMKLKLGIDTTQKPIKINNASIVNQLKELSELYQKGTLSKSEYEKAKNILLKN